MFEMTTEPDAKVIQTPDIIKHWQDFGKIYSEHFEYNTQPMLYSLIMNLQIFQAEKLLELSCGGGKSISVVLSMKKPDCEYIATDISKNMLNLSMSRMEYIETDFKGNLQFFDEFAFNEKEKTNYKNYFPNNKTSFYLMNNEVLEFKDESFDICFSNLSLMIVENPEKMISESFRVLKKGGKAGFTVWGNQEKSLFFSLPKKIVQKYKINLPNDRGCFHLNDRKLLITMFENAGFKNILCWSQFFAYNFQTEEDFNLHLDTKGIKKSFDLIPNEEERKKIRKEVLDEFMGFIQKGEPVGLDIFFIIGEKL